MDAGLALGTYTVFNATTFTAPTTLTINGESGFWYGGENKKFELASDAASLTVTVSEVAAPEMGEAAMDINGPVSEEEVARRIVGGVKGLVERRKARRARNGR